MLCYQYSRKANDIIHDTFDWMRINRRAVAVVMWPLAVMCLIGALATYHSFTGYDTSSTENEFLSFLKMLVPFALSTEGGSDLAIICYIGMTAVVTMLTVPLLRRYFYYRRSLKHASLNMVLTGLKRDWRPSVLSALVMAAMCAGLISGNALTVTVMILLLWPLYSLLPCIIMGQRLSLVVSRFGRFMINIGLSLLFFCLVQALPLLCQVVFALAKYFLMDIIPINYTVVNTVNSGITLAFITVMYLSFCAATMMFLVNMVLIHGSMYHNPSFQQQ